jgi:hypothetical protein
MESIILRAPQDGANKAQDKIVPCSHVSVLSAQLVSCFCQLYQITK